MDQVVFVPQILSSGMKIIYIQGLEDKNNEYIGLLMGVVRRLVPALGGTPFYLKVT